MLKLKIKNETEKIFCKRCKRPGLELKNNQCLECKEEFSKLQFKTEKVTFQYYKTKENHISGNIGYEFLSYYGTEPLTYFEEYEIEVTLPEFSEIDARKRIIKQKEKELEILKQDLNLF